jgi:hypothetical protein
VPNHDEQLTRWWASLSEQERADALAASKSGRLTEGLQQSLRNSGVPQSGRRSGRAIPADVDDFLRMRHDPA